MLRKDSHLITLALMAYMFIASVSVANGTSFSPELLTPSVENQEALEVLPYSRYVLDESAESSPEDILELMRSGSGSAPNTPSINLGLTKSAVWFYFNFEIPAEKSLLHWYLSLDFSNFDELRLFQIKSNNTITELERQRQFNLTGSSLTPPYHPLFLLLQEPAEQYEYLMKAKSEEPLLVKALILSERALVAETRQVYLIFGIYLGIIGLLAIYNLCLWLGFRDISYLWYSVLISSIAAVFFVNRDLGIDWQWLYDRDRLFVITIWFLSLAMWSALQLNCAYLKLKRYDPLSFRMTQAGTIGIVSALFLALLIPDNLSILIATLIAVFLCFTLLFSSIRAVISGNKEARYILPAWIIFVIGLVVHAGVFNGVVEYTFWTLHSLQIASVFQAFILSLALSARIRKLNMEREQLSQVGQELQRLADIDTLTELYNKRFCELEVKRLFAEAQFHDQALSVLILDIDRFKFWNDSFGHLSGDNVLRKFGAILRKQLRPSDKACRYGGEEFVVILPGTGIDEAALVAERIRAAVQQGEFESQDGKIEELTVSIGVSEVTPSMSAPDDVLNKADEALYRGKRGGRNRVERADQ